MKEVETVLHKKQTPVGGREKGTSSQEVREREKAERECMGERETDIQTESNRVGGRAPYISRER